MADKKRKNKTNKKDSKLINRHTKEDENKTQRMVEQRKRRKYNTENGRRGRAMEIQH